VSEAVAVKDALGEGETELDFEYVAVIDGDLEGDVDGVEVMLPVRLLLPVTL
jgi:hypothetical protein